MQLTGKKKMMIGGWVEPIGTYEDYKLAKDMGITHMFIGDSCFGIERDTEKYFELLKMAEKAGLKAVIRTMNTYPFSDKTDYTEFDNVWGINYWDEPFCKDFSKLTEMAEKHIQKYKDNLVFFVNLNPNETTEGWHPWGEDETYKDYIEQFCEKVLSKITVGEKILSADIYPIIMTAGKTYIKDTYLRGLECIAAAAKKYGLDTHFYVQAASFYAGESLYPILTDKELRFQFNTLMAFGIRNFTYYTYADYGEEGKSGYAKAFVSNKVSCKPHELYHYAKTVNAEIQKIEEVYLSFEWQGTLTAGGTDSEEDETGYFEGLENTLKEVPIIKSCACSQNTLIGIFANDDGEDAVLISNFTLPQKGKTDTVNIEFREKKKAILYLKGNKEEIELKKGVLNLDLYAGEGAFVILK